MQGNWHCVEHVVVAAGGQVLVLQALRHILQRCTGQS
jgi:hypothetical protein